MVDYYAILGVSPTATPDDIRRAYRRLALRHHPDRGGRHEVMVRINKAYEVLSDPVRRAAYDQARAEWERRRRQQATSVDQRPRQDPQRQRPNPNPNPNPNRNPNPNQTPPPPRPKPTAERPRPAWKYWIWGSLWILAVIGYLTGLVIFADDGLWAVVTYLFFCGRIYLAIVGWVIDQIDRLLGD